MKIGILGGTFNPPHYGHLNIGAKLLKSNIIDEFWINPTYKPFWKRDTINCISRLKMCKLSIEGYSNFKVVSIDIDNQFLYTYQTIKYIKEKYPENEIYFIKGDDINIKKHFNKPEEILDNCKVITINRIQDISSSKIRNNIMDIKIKKLLPKQVYNYIIENQLYNSKKNIKEKDNKMKKRLDSSNFLKELNISKLRNGWYSDIYFVRAKEILESENHHPITTMQVFQKNNAILGGIDEAIAVLKYGSGYYTKDGDWIDGWNDIEVKALYDGVKIKPFDPVMTIKGDYTLYAHLETVYLGILARRTRIATNVNNVIQAANEKPVLFFPARFDHPSTQTGDGYTAYLNGIKGVSTEAQDSWWGSKAIGTIPHALIAAYNGDTVKATLAFSKWVEKTNQNINVVSLVDFDNDCIGTSLKVAKALGKKLWGVRLDTSATMVDKSLWNLQGQFKPTGVNSKLVFLLRKALDDNNYNHVKIIVSGGFSPDKIRQFENEKVPADIYAVGSHFLSGNFDYTADIVIPCSKNGRKYIKNNKLERVKK